MEHPTAEKQLQYSLCYCIRQQFQYSTALYSLWPWPSMNRPRVMQAQLDSALFPSKRGWVHTRHYHDTQIQLKYILVLANTYRTPILQRLGKRGALAQIGIARNLANLGIRIPILNPFYCIAIKQMYIPNCRVFEPCGMQFVLENDIRYINRVVAASWKVGQTSTDTN